MSDRTKLMLAMAKKDLMNKPTNQRSPATLKILEIVTETNTLNEANFTEASKQNSSFQQAGKQDFMKLTENFKIIAPPILNEAASSFVNDLEMLNASDNDSFDDSDADPNYSPVSCSTDDESESVELIVMGAQLEKNLEMPVIENFSLQNLTKSQLIKQRQIMRNTGKEYKTGRDRIVKERKCLPLEKCRKNCAGRLMFHDQKKLFETYWNLGSYTSRIIFLSGLISIEEPKNRRQFKSIIRPKTRNYTCVYHLKLGLQNIIVCQKCFRLTFGETDNVLKTVIKKKMSMGDTKSLCDLRGSGAPSSKISEQKINEVKYHINSFPSYESHYTRHHTQKRYLSSGLNIATMYKMYREKYSDPISLTKYSEIFNGMNIKFKQPKSDTCSNCEKFKIQIQICNDDSLKNEITQKQSLHHEQADFAYHCKKTDKAKAQSDSSTKVFTFDLQQCLPTPCLENSLSFYKRQLWTFNLTVHDLVTNQPYCYMWSEIDGHRGGNEIASCLFEHLNSLDVNTKNIVLYSDNCAGQNKNSMVSSMFSVFMCNNDNIQLIDHKFLISGHTHMECDSDHALIERKKKKTSINLHVPRDWFQFVRTVGTKQNFLVHEMNKDKFYDFTKILKTKFMWRKVDQEKNKFIWRNIQWLRYKKEFGMIYYKNSLREEEPFKILNIRRRGVNNINAMEIAKCYTGPLKISKEKKRDLLDLLQFIDPSLHNFYLDLVDDNVDNMDPSTDTDGGTDGEEE